MRRTTLWIVSAALSIAFSIAASGATIVSSKHNLSASGPGPIRALGEERICVFCHTPHGGRGDAPLWNRRDSSEKYLPYDSPTMTAQPGQPTGASKLCLSCHDGTVAMGDLLSEGQPIAMAGGDYVTEGHGLIGTDLRDDHPISFNYFESLSGSEGQLTTPSTWDRRVRLDANSELQCTACHDPHDDQWGNFLVMDNTNAALCRQCHLLDLFSRTPHDLSGAPWNGGGPDPWPHTNYPDVRTNACLNCHYPHHAGGVPSLLRSAKEEDDCYVCHNGNVAQYNIERIFQKFSHHPVELAEDEHEANEDPATMPRHVECVDCHNPHRAYHAPAQAPAVSGALDGVTGIDLSGTQIKEAANEYEICFKCHADTAPEPANGIIRLISSFNLRLDIAPSSPSFHPIAEAGKNPDVPSLISPLNPASLIYCTDCHNSDEAQPDLLGSRGPHGSSHEFILARAYATGDNVTESAGAYALCYGCHSQTSIMGNESFPQHDVHISGERSSCSVCHDPHGIDLSKGNPTNNAHLINFDKSVVDTDPVTGRLEYRSLGSRTGECYLRCHGVNHSPRSYSP